MDLKTIVVFMLVMATQACGYNVVPPGSVGLLVVNAGGDRGIHLQPQGGRIWTGPNENVVVLPTTVHNTIWTASTTEGAPHDESISFSVAGGVNVNADVGINFRLDPAKAERFYMQYHQDVPEFADGQLRNITRDCLGHEAAAMSISDNEHGLLMGGRNELLAGALECIRTAVSPHGIIVEDLTFVGSFRLPQNVQAAINTSLEAQQHLAQAQAQGRAAQAAAEGEANAARARAQGAADAERIRATGDAAALTIRTQADLDNRRLMAQAYNSLNPTLTPAVLQYLSLTRWNGVLPTVSGGSSNGPMLSIPGLLH